MINNQKNIMIATLGGGCFWCLEAIFERVNGVESVVSGYSGGFLEDPTYGEVCNEDTGHAEVVQVTFNSEIICFKEILDVFFSIHDPTQLNRQGNDVGTQYRSEIFYHSQFQKDITKKTIEKLNQTGTWKKPVVTKVTRFEKFYPAGDHHQNYYRDNPYQPYCRVVIAPKLSRFMEKYPSSNKDIS